MFQFLHSQKGAVIVLTAVVMPLMLIGAGFAIDLGNIYQRKSRLQDTADAAAIAGVLELTRLKESYPNINVTNQELNSYASAGNDDYNVNTASDSSTIDHAWKIAERYVGRFNNNTYNSSKLTMNRTFTPNADLNTYHVKLTETVSTHFMQYFGVDDIKIQATATAKSALRQGLFHRLLTVHSSFTLPTLTNAAFHGNVAYTNDTDEEKDYTPTIKINGSTHTSRSLLYNLSDTTASNAMPYDRGSKLAPTSLLTKINTLKTNAAQLSGSEIKTSALKENSYHINNCSSINIDTYLSTDKTLYIDGSSSSSETINLSMNKYSTRANLIIVYLGYGTIHYTDSGSHTFSGLIYAPHGKVIFDSGSQFIFNGSIVADSFAIGENAAGQLNYQQVLSTSSSSSKLTSLDDGYKVIPLNLAANAYQDAVTDSLTATLISDEEAGISN